MYNPNLGIFGNLKLIAKQLSRTESEVAINKQEAITGFNENEDASVELASIISDLCDAVAELGEIIAEME